MIVVLAILLVPLTSHSAPSAPGPNQGSSKDFRVSIGPALISTHKYEGDSGSTSHLLPSFNLNYKDRVTFNPRGLLYSFYPDEHFTISGGLSYNFGRDESDSYNLKGLGSIDETFLGIFAVNYRLGRFLEFASRLESGIGGSYGELLLFRMSCKVARISNILFVKLVANVAYADNDYMDSFFSITPKQAANSPYQQYNADAGFKSNGIALHSIYLINKNWQMLGVIKQSRLINDAASSPLVFRKYQDSMVVSLQYSF